MKFLHAVDIAHVRNFRTLSEAYFAETYQRFPQAASRLGLEKFNDQLGANDVATHKAQIKLAEKTLAAVEALPEAAFHGDDWLDRRAFVSMLRTELLESRDLERWRNNPQVHCDTAVDSIFDLLVRYADKVATILPAIEARLAAIPDFLDAGARCLNKPVPLWTQLAQKACEGAVSFLGEIEETLAVQSQNPAKTRRLIASASKAFADYAATIGRRKQGEARGYAIGRANFEYLIRERLGLDFSLPEARANGERLVAHMELLLEQEAAKYGRRSAQEAIEAAARGWLPERPLLDEYKEVTSSLKEQLRSLDIVSLPHGETLKVLPTPAFLRHHFPTAAYNAPPPFSKKQQGIFWVNDLSLLEKSAARKQAEIKQHFGLELTSVHEGYPGHHLQFAVQNRLASKIRRQSAHSIFYEGWTMWCESMAVERKLVKTPVARLLQIHDALWRAHRIVIDCGLHDGSLSFDAACKMLMDGVHFTRARAAGDVNWYTSSPTVPMSYLLGRIEVEKLYRRFVGGEGWTLKQFNDWILSHGAIPWSWISRVHDQGV